jgi:hypothetical protein
MTFSIDTQYNSIECHYAECNNFFIILSVVMPSVVMLSVVMPNVVIPSIVAPRKAFQPLQSSVIFVRKASRTFWVGSLPYPQILDLAGRSFQVQPL